MGRIVVFDSGFGSLSIIMAIHKQTKSNIIYFADQKNFPYGKKSERDLRTIIERSISELQKMFHPDLIVVGSNTPSLLFPDLINRVGVMGVLPPIKEAQRLTKTNSIALLVTSSAAKSVAMKNFLAKHHNKKINFLTIDASKLVDLVESGKFIDSKIYCTKTIISVLKKTFEQNNVDIATLSSTHLPFLLPFLQTVFPDVTFLDPADGIADKIAKQKMFSPSARNTLKIFSSGDTHKFESRLKKIGIKKTVHRIDI